jgi:hypothetical protein
VVHTIEPGHVLDHNLDSGRIRKLSATTGDLVTDLGTIEWKHTGAPLMPRNISRAAATPAAQRPNLGSGWITYADWYNSTGQPVTRFATTWVVPPPPSTQSGQTIFLFNGIQNDTMIYQPVLQWGPSAAGGGNYWAAASWYVDGQNGPAFKSSLVPVNPGDLLVGVMIMTGQLGAGFNCNCYFEHLANTALAIQNVQELKWCIETLETYGTTARSDYPMTDCTRMTAIELEVGDGEAILQWQPVNQVTDTGQHCVVASNKSPGGEVDLFYDYLPALQMADITGNGRSDLIFQGIDNRVWISLSNGNGGFANPVESIKFAGKLA